MNKKKRDILKRVWMSLDEASNRVSSVLDNEQDCLENIPENLQASEKYERIEDAIDKLESAVEYIELAMSSIMEASE